MEFSESRLKMSRRGRGFPRRASLDLRASARGGSPLDRFSRVSVVLSTRSRSGGARGRSSCRGAKPRSSASGSSSAVAGSAGFESAWGAAPDSSGVHPVRVGPIGRCMRRRGPWISRTLQAMHSQWPSGSIGQTHECEPSSARSGRAGPRRPESASARIHDRARRAVVATSGGIYARADRMHPPRTRRGPPKNSE